MLPARKPTRASPTRPLGCYAPGTGNLQSLPETIPTRRCKTRDLKNTSTLYDARSSSEFPPGKKNFNGFANRLRAPSASTLHSTFASNMLPYTPGNWAAEVRHAAGHAGHHETRRTTPHLPDNVRAEPRRHVRGPGGFRRASHLPP